MSLPKSSVPIRYALLGGRSWAPALFSGSKGASAGSIIFDEILPNALPPVIVQTILTVSSVILLEATLSFLGLGDPTLMSWGLMLQNAQTFLRLAPWMALFPGLGIFFCILGLNLMGDGLNQALNPRLRTESSR